MNVSQELTSLFRTLLEPQAATVVLGITYGIKANFSAETTRAIRDAGLSHIMVFSGSNVVIIYSLFYQLFYPAHKKLRIVLSTSLLLLFLTIVPWEASVFRATLMALQLRIGEFFGKKTNRIYLLILTCLTMLMIDGTLITNISFQLSFAAIAGIMLFQRKLQSSSAIVASLKEDLQTTIHAQVFTAPIIYYYFHSIAIFSIISNIMVTPVVKPILILGLLLPISHKMIPVTTEFVSGLANTTSQYIVFVANTIK